MLGMNFDFTSRDVKKLMALRKKILTSKKEKTIANRIRIIRCKKICHRNNAFIPVKAKINSDVVFPHGLYGIFISQGAVIGKGCTIFHQVTIGSNTLPDSPGYGAPELGENVYIGAGAKIIGKIHIGNNVRIGANAVVTTDVPDNATVVQERSRIIFHENARNNRFTSFNTN